MNLQFLKEQMRTRGLDAVIASSHVNTSYLTDGALTTPWAFMKWSPVYVIVPREGASALVCVSRYYDRGDTYPDPPDWIDEVHALGKGEDLGALDSKRIVESLADLLRKKNLSRGVLGIEMGGKDRSSMPLAVYEVLRRRLPAATFEAADNAFLATRISKTDEEVGLIQEAIEIDQAAIQHALSLIAPGVLISDLWHSLRSSVERGGGLFWGSHLINLDGGTDELYKGTRFGEDEVYTFDTFITTWSYTEGRRRHYWADLARCGTATKPSNADVELYREAGEISKALAECIRVDQTIPEANSALVKGLERWKEYRPVVLVHSVGLSVHEQPMFQVGNLENGFWIFDEEEEAHFKFRHSTPFQIELDLRPRDTGSHPLHVEDTYLLTEMGADRMTTWPFALYYDGQWML